MHTTQRLLVVIQSHDMILPTLTCIGSYFAPRSRSSKWCLSVILCFLLVGVVSFKSGFLHYVLESQLLNRKHYSMQELAAMVPYEIDNPKVLQSDTDTRPTGLSHVNKRKDEMLNIVSGCETLNPKTVFVIRIAKCASTSFVQLLKPLAKRSVFELFFHPSGAYDWDVRTMKEVADLAIAKQNRFVYARHFYYVDFHRFNLDDYTYVTFIRDPVTRFVSSFLYYHYSSKQYIQSMLNPAHRNETILECMERQHEGCAHNLMTKYFCGHYRFCKLGNEEALTRAMENLQKDFAVVGLVEEMEMSLRVMAKTLPKYFRDLGSHEASVINKNEHQKDLTESEVERIQEANGADMKLYQYAQQLLHSKALACKLK